MKLYKRWATVGVAFTMIGVVAGCGTNGSVISGSDPATNATVPSASALSPVKYTTNQLAKIRRAATLNDVSSPYVPTQSLTGDSFVSAGGGNSSPNSIPKDGTFSLVFNDMTINESNQPIIGGGIVVTTENTTVQNSTSANWIEIQGKVGSPKWVLSFKKGATYINMETHGSKSETVNIAASLTLLKNFS